MRCVECFATTGVGRGPKKPDMGNRKVVITGLGLATALGLEVEESWRRALSGVCGVSRVKLPCAGKSSVQAAGQVSAEDWERICRRVSLRGRNRRGAPDPFCSLGRKRVIERCRVSAKRRRPLEVWSDAWFGTWNKSAGRHLQLDRPGEKIRFSAVCGRIGPG